jgi:hypothetical protein
MQHCVLAIPPHFTLRKTLRIAHLLQHYLTFLFTRCVGANPYVYWLLRVVRFFIPVWQELAHVMHF